MMMRNGLWYMIVVFLCLMAAKPDCQAQNSWDSVLDRYESITAQCKALRDKVAAGEPVSQKSVTSIFDELGRLRNMLQQSSGRMSKAQRERFERIKRSYDGGAADRAGGEAKVRSSTNPVGESGSLAGERPFDSAQGPGNPAGAPQRPVGEPVEPTATTAGPVLHLAQAKFEPLPAVDGGKILRSVLPQALRQALRQAQDNAQDNAQDFAQNDTHVILSGAEGETKDLIAKSFNVLPTFSFGDTRQGGLFLGMSRGLWGGYVSVRSNLKSQLYAYDILSDGTTGGEATFEPKGGQRLGEYSAAAGVVRTVTPWMDLYVGAGYGSSTLCWNDIHGAWAKVRDYSAAGLLLDGGAVFHVGRLSLLGGVSWLTAHPEAGPFLPVFSVGAGISF